MKSIALKYSTNLTYGGRGLGYFYCLCLYRIHTSAEKFISSYKIYKLKYFSTWKLKFFFIGILNNLWSVGTGIW